MQYSTAPYSGLPTDGWLALLAALEAEGCTATSVMVHQGIWHGHSRDARVWTITGPGRQLTVTEGWNCCTGAPHLVGVEGYCPEWAPKMAYAASVSSGPQRERALQAVGRCAAMEEMEMEN